MDSCSKSIRELKNAIKKFLYLGGLGAKVSFNRKKTRGRILVPAGKNVGWALLFIHGWLEGTHSYHISSGLEGLLAVSTRSF